MQITSSSGMRIGKNGFSVYSTWSSKTKGRKQLFKWQANTKKHIQISNFKAGISRFSLSPDGNYIVARVSGEGKELYKLWLYNTSTGKWEKLPSKSNARYINVKWHRDSKYFYFSSNEDNLRDFHIYVYNIKTKNVSKLIELKGFNLVSDSSKNGDNIIIINFLSYDENRPYIYNIKEKKLNPILWQKAKKNMFRNLFYSMDEGEIYLYTNIFSDYNTLAKYNVRTKKIIPILKELTANYEINGLRHHLNRELFSFIINEKAYNKAYITSPKSGWKVEAFEPLGEGMYEITKITENKIYFTFQNTQRPNDAYIISRTFKTGKAVNLTNSLTQGIALESFSLPKLVYT
ncbi:MAG: hypothetical protein OEV44_13085, partial [Spirochaetota bacterium]|nr:hypothetical protein [Spirochaetota bacterium]